MKIFVCTHKKVDFVLPENYEYIQVNAIKNGKLYPLTDADSEDNISEKNPYFCELTACYYVWKNVTNQDIVGLAHYRRFFTTNRLSSSPKSYINEKKITKALKKCDFITTKLYKTKTTVKEHLLINVSGHDYDLLRETVNEVCPEYIESFDKIMLGNKSHLLNMFITTKDKWDSYYEWLFKIFDKLEPKIDMTGYTVQQQRLYGFLSERLFSVYLLKNGFSTYEMPTFILGESKLTTIKNKLKRILHLN